MAEAGCDLLFLADRLSGRDEIESLKELFRGLERRGHTWRLICRSTDDDHGLPELTECQGLRNRWLRPWAIRGLDLGVEFERPRLMHVLSAGMAEIGLEIAERHQIPYLCGVDEFPSRCFRLRLSRLWCRGLVASNRELALALVRDFEIPASSIREVPRGIPGRELPARQASDGRVPVIGASGPLVAGSGFSTFLNAARKVVDAGVDAEFLIAGQGEDEADLRRRAQRLRIAERLTLADEIPDGLTFWNVLDVYCQTSVAPAVGRPLAHAMASGVPSIASDVEGLRMLVRHGETGLIVPHGDSASLARSILELLADLDRSRSLGEEGRKAALLDHHPNLEAERLDSLYREIVRVGPGPRDSGLARRANAFDAPSGLDTARVVVPDVAVVPGLVSER